MAVYGAVGIGTNSVRILVAEVEADKIIPIEAMAIVTRLGEGMGHGVLEVTQEALSRTSAALKQFREILARFEPVATTAVTTSVTRQALNKKDVVTCCSEALGVNVEVIGGEEEARLSYQGATALLPGIFPGMVVVVDVGGGSTEVVVGSGNEAYKAQSINIGVVRLRQTAENLSGLHCFLTRELRPILECKIDKAVAVGGSATSLVALKKGLDPYDWRQVHGSPLTRVDLEELYLQLVQMTDEERERLPGLQPGRGDVITGGAMILLALMETLGQDHYTVSEADLLYGLVLKARGPYKLAHQ